MEDTAAASSAWVPAYATITTSMLPEPVAREAAQPTSTVSKILQGAVTETLSGSLVLSSLCQPCEGIFNGVIPSKELGNAAQHSLGQTVSQLKASAQQTCHLCRVRLSQLSSADLEKLSQEQDITYGYWESRLGNGIAFDYATTRLQDKPITKSIALLSIEGFAGTIKSLLIRKAELTLSRSASEVSTECSSSMNSPSSMISILSWIESCKNHHIKCRRSSSRNRSLPTRIIDIGQGSTIKPVLRLTSQLPASMLYVTLSHCWGGRVFLKLLKSNVEALQQNINVSQLSKTFRDAMEVTWRLGLRYIWIDSLCIIQDCETDWGREASCMADIYSYSYLTIAATAAKDGRDGLFQQRNKADVEPCLVDVQWTGYRRSVYFCYGIDEWHREVDKQPLLSRAWVVQERLLSPRIVHFSREQLFWECQECLASESYPEKIPNLYACKTSIYPTDNQLENLFRTTAADDDHSFAYHKIWKDAVELYSRTELTFKTKDKLVAISGVASRLEIPATDYLAGLWRTGLAEQLLWSVDRRKDSSSQTPVRSAKYRAPSWSWTSIDGGIYMSTPTREALKHACVEILEASTKLIDPKNPYGQVSDGALRLRCMLATAPVSQRFICRNTSVSLRQGRMVEIQLGSPSIVHPHLFISDEHVTISFDEGDDVIIGQRLLFVPISQQSGGSGLVIHPTGRKPGEYRRIGKFSVLQTFSLHPGLHLLSLCRAFPEMASDEYSYESEAGDEDDGICRYIITLI